MKKSVLFLFAVLLSLPRLAEAYEDDDVRKEQPWYGGRRGGTPLATILNPLYYRPTQRYYGNGYTISYRYVPVYLTDGVTGLPARGASNFRTEAFLLPTDEARSWGINSPRLTVRDAKSAAPRTAVTTIVRKKTTGKLPAKSSAETTPAIVPSATDGASEPAVPAPKNP